MGQVFIIPLCLVLSSLVGLVITSCAAGIYPDEVRRSSSHRASTTEDR
jgi:cytosine/uracil/thiamine/allantoin permease